MFNCIQYRFGCKLSLLSIFPLRENPHLKRSWFWYSRLRVWMPGVHLPSAKSYRCPCKNWAGQKIGTHTLTLMIDSYWWLKENLKNGEKKKEVLRPLSFLCIASIPITFWELGYSARALQQRCCPFHQEIHVHACIQPTHDHHEEWCGAKVRWSHLHWQNSGDTQHSWF